MHGSRGCFGCCSKPSTSIVGDRSRIQDQPVNKSSMSDYFWSTSVGEMDDSVFPSEISISSISNQPLDPQSSSGCSTSNPSEFVNHGLILWNQNRQQWIGNKRPQNKKQVREPMISWNATYESLLGTNKRFSQRIPLAEMVDFLVDVWEQEGLYD